MGGTCCLLIHAVGKVPYRASPSLYLQAVLSGRQSVVAVQLAHAMPPPESEACLVLDPLGVAGFCLS